MVKGTREQAEALKAQITTLLATELRLTLSPAKTLVTHIDDGFDFLGFRIQRKARGPRRVVYTFPSRAAFEAVKRAIKDLTVRSTLGLALADVLRRLNALLRGWTSYFRHAASKRTFAYLDFYVWWRVARWLWKKHKQPSWKRLRRRALPQGQPQDGQVVLMRVWQVPVTRYRYRGTRIPTPWDAPPVPVAATT